MFPLPSWKEIAIISNDSEVEGIDAAIPNRFDARYEEHGTFGTNGHCVLLL